MASMLHAVVKVPGQRLFAAADWNAEHSYSGFILDDGSVPFVNDVTITSPSTNTEILTIDADLAGAIKPTAGSHIYLFNNALGGSEWLRISVNQNGDAVFEVSANEMHFFDSGANVISMNVTLGLIGLAQLATNTGAADLIDFTGIVGGTSIFTCLADPGPGPANPVVINQWIPITVGGVPMWLPSYL